MYTGEMISVYVTYCLRDPQFVKDGYVVMSIRRITVDTPYPMVVGSVHALKTWPEYFKAVCEGFKTFEVRKDDRPYNVGDVLVLQEYVPQEGG